MSAASVDVSGKTLRRVCAGRASGRAGVCSFGAPHPAFGHLLPVNGEKDSNLMPTQKESRLRGSLAATRSRWPGIPIRGCRFQGQASLGCAAGRGSRRGATHRRNTNQASATAPTLNSVSAGTRIHTSISTIGCCMNSAERAYQ